MARYSSQWAAIGAVAAKIGCQPETLRIWIRQAERNQGLRPAVARTPRPAAGMRQGAARSGIRKCFEYDPVRYAACVEFNEAGSMS